MGVFGMRYPLVIIAVVVLALGSFADEAMLVSFALTLASGDSKNLTLLYALSMMVVLLPVVVVRLFCQKLVKRLFCPLCFFYKG